MPKIIVNYWDGTTKYRVHAHSYNQAMALASMRRNAYSPTFETESGETLVDAGGCLVEEKELEAATRENRPVVAYA